MTLDVDRKSVSIVEKKAHNHSIPKPFTEHHKEKAPFTSKYMVANRLPGHWQFNWSFLLVGGEERKVHQNLPGDK